MQRCPCHRRNGIKCLLFCWECSVSIIFQIGIEFFRALYTKLKDAYSACINTAEGNPDKIEACQSVLNVLKKDKQHQQFANQESVRVLDYQQCIQATRTGNDQAVKARCDQIWKEIRSNNTTH